MTTYDFGFIQPPVEGKGVKITVNNFRNQWYLHVREYLQDGDTSEWYPTKKGISIKAEYVDLAAYIMQDAGKLLTQIYYDEIAGITKEKQLNLFESIDER